MITISHNSLEVIQSSGIGQLYRNLILVIPLIQYGNTKSSVAIITLCITLEIHRNITLSLSDNKLHRHVQLHIQLQSISYMINRLISLANHNLKFMNPNHNMACH